MSVFAGFIWVRPWVRRVNQWSLGSLGYALVLVGFVQGRWNVSRCLFGLCGIAELIDVCCGGGLIRRG